MSSWSSTAGRPATPTASRAISTVRRKTLSFPNGATPATTTSTLTFGMGGLHSEADFNGGVIDGARVYNRALCATEIRSGRGHERWLRPSGRLLLYGTMTGRPSMKRTHGLG